MSDLMETLERRFTSGNDVPVTRAHITRDEYETLRAKVAELENSEQKSRITAHEIGKDNKRLNDYLTELRERRFTRFAEDECWIYDKHGENHLESLVCPVVISPGDLLSLERKVAELEAGSDRKRLDEAPGLCDWLYRAGYVTAQKQRDYDPRGHQAWQDCYDALTTPQPVKVPEGCELVVQNVHPLSETSRPRLIELLRNPPCAAAFDDENDYYEDWWWQLTEAAKPDKDK